MYNISAVCFAIHSPSDCIVLLRLSALLNIVYNPATTAINVAAVATTQVT